MIPKKIHYCWFGNNPKPKLAQRCIASWKKFCPDYEIIEWNESNFDIHSNPYVEMCYHEKKYAFLTDYLRLVLLEQFGGIYFDTDVELVRSFDDLLSLPAFFGFENDQFVASGLGCGAIPHNPVIQEMIGEYDQLIDGAHGTIGCPILNTEALKKRGLILDGSLQDLEYVRIFPQDYFNPYDDPTGILTKTNNTYSIHWYGKSWMNKKKVIRSRLTRPLHRWLGKDFFHRCKK